MRQQLSIKNWTFERRTMPSKFAYLVSNQDLTAGKVSSPEEFIVNDGVCETFLFIADK